MREIVKHKFTIDKTQKEDLLGQKGMVIWLFGLSGSGKSTMANNLESILFEKGLLTAVLDGDSLRSGICSDLGFSPKDRDENIRRAAEIAKMMASNGLITICSFITPFENQRKKIQQIFQSDLHLIWVNCSLEDCEKRDPKGLYKKAKSGEISDFTGVSSSFELPTNPNLVINSSQMTIEECTSNILAYLKL